MCRVVYLVERVEDWLLLLMVRRMLGLALLPGL
jgi:hypothetical protein